MTYIEYEYVESANGYDGSECCSELYEYPEMATLGDKTYYCEKITVDGNCIYERHSKKDGE